MNDSFEFDAAISFLSDDELIAKKISDELSKNFDIFFFPTSQKEIAGKDGVDTFSQTFLNNSKLNIVLFREKWGKTKWTRIEETSIKNRIFNGDGWDSLFLIKLENTDTPSWIPPTYIYTPIDQYDLKELIAILKFRIQERGGQLKEESLAGVAKRIQTEHTLKKDIYEYLHSEKALSDAKNEINELLKIFESKYIELKESSSDLAIGEMKKDLNNNHFQFPVIGTHLHFKWNQYYSNSLNNSKLEIILYPKNNKSQNFYYEFTMNQLKQVGWSNSKLHEFITSEKLVDYWMKEHLKLAATNRKKNFL